MAEVRRTPQAEVDLVMILGDLNQNDPVFAQRYATAFGEKSKVLGQFPEIGRPPSRNCSKHSKHARSPIRRFLPL